MNTTEKQWVTCSFSHGITGVFSKSTALRENLKIINYFDNPKEALASLGRYRFHLKSDDGDYIPLEIKAPSFDKAKEAAENSAYDHWCSDGQRWYVEEI